MSAKAKFALIAALLGAMLAGGAVGLALFGPGSATAQSSTPSASPAAKTFTSNENGTHEKGEAAAREADENAGRGFHHGMHACPQTSPAPTGANRSCEDSAHEKGENAQREADENAGRAGFQHAGRDQNG